MAFIYSASGKQIPLRLSSKDIGIRFDEPASASMAMRAFLPRPARAAGGRRVLRARGLAPMLEGAARSPVRSFGSFLMMPGEGETHAPIRALATALPSKQVRRAERSAPIYIDDDSNLRAIATHEITVRFRRQPSPRTIRLLLRSRRLSILRKNPFHPHQYVVAQDGRPDEWKTVDLANALFEASEVEFAAPNFVSEYRRHAQTNDPLLADQWHLDNRGKKGATKGEDVSAFAAWDLTPGGSPDVVIAIIDDGVDLRHPDLKRNIWTHPSRSAPDRHGRNFFDADYPNDPSPRHFHSPYQKMDGNDIHGTCCAGVAAAVGNNRKGVAGIAYRSRILPVKIFGGDDLATDDNVANAIRYAGLHAQILSCSWGGVQNADLESAVNETARTGRKGKGCLIFCATGNESQPRVGFPARYPGALGVGASNDRGKRSKYSNYGPEIEFVAPSDDSDYDHQGITTTDVSMKNRGFKLNSAYTDDFGGTSSATPLAAGIAALVLSVHPALTRDEVRDVLRSTAVKIDAAKGGYSKGHSVRYGYGRLDAHAAVAKAIALKSKKKTVRKKK